MNVDEGRHILEEVKRDFMRDVDARAIAQKARTEEIIPEAVEIQINESKSSDAAKNVLFEHLHHQVMLEGLGRFCSIMIESKGYQRMQMFGKGLLAKVEEFMPRPGSSQVLSAAASDLEMEGGIVQQQRTLGKARRKRPPDDHADHEWKRQKDSETADQKTFVHPAYDVEEADRFYLNKAIMTVAKGEKLDTLKLKKDLYRHTYYSVERILEANAQYFRHMVRAAKLATEDEEDVRALTAACTVEELLDKLCIQTKLENTELLAEIVLSLPKEPRTLAMGLLKRYEGYLEVYDNLVPAQDCLQMQLAVPEVTKPQVSVEVTVKKRLDEFMSKDCKDIVNLLLHNSYQIPRIDIRATDIQIGSTTVVFQIGKAFTENIIHFSRKVSSLWAFQELRVTRVRVGAFELNVVQLLTLHFKEALRSGLTGSMDFVGATKALPYQLYALVDPDISEKLVIRTVYGKIAHPCPEQELASGTAHSEGMETTPEMGGADQDSAMTAPSGVCSKRISRRWWLKISAGSYDTSLLPFSPMEQAKGGREMEGEVVFRRDTKSNLLKAVSGTEWMYRRGALERGRRSATANLHQHQFTRYHQNWLVDNVQKVKEESFQQWLLQSSPDVGSVREGEEQGLAVVERQHTGCTLEGAGSGGFSPSQTGSETPSSAHPPIDTCQTASTSKKAQATSTAGQPVEKRVFMECETHFFKVVAVKEIYQELCQKHVIPQTVANQITNSHSVEEARGHLFDHMRHYGTIDTLKVFCDVITSEKYNGFRAMHDIGAELRRRLEQEDISHTGASTVDRGRDPVLSQKVSDHLDHLILFRKYVSRKAAIKGRAVLERVGLLTETIDACFSSHPLDEEGAVQAGLTRWSGGQGRQPPTWQVLLEAMTFAQIAQEHVQGLKKTLGVQEHRSKPIPAQVTDDHVFKLLIIGDSGVGKSCLLMQFSDNLFSDTTTPTTGVDIKNCTVDVEAAKVKLKIWDTAGQERFRTITSMHYRGTHGVIFVYDVTNANTFKSIKKWLHEIDQNCDRVSRVLVGNKDDNHEKKVVPLEEAQQFAEQIGIPLYETSAKEGKNVEEVFHAIAQLVLKQKWETEAQEAVTAGDKIVVQSGAMRGSGGGGEKWSCCS